MEITDEIRQAVYDADCAELGHIINIDNAFSNDPDTHPERHTLRVRSEDPDTIPHVSCQRCHRVWLIVTDAPVGYDAALSAFNKKVLAQNKLRTREDRRAVRVAAETTKRKLDKANAEREFKRQQSLADARALIASPGAEIIDVPEVPVDARISASKSPDPAS